MGGCLSVPPSGGGWPRDPTQRSAQRLVGGTFTILASLQQDTRWKLSEQRMKTPAAPFLPFLPPLQHQARCLPCSRGAGNIPGAGSIKVLKRFCSFTGSQRAIPFNTHPLSFSLAMLLSVLHWLSFPSFLSSPLPLIPFRDSKGLIQHSTGRDKLKQRGDLQLGRVLRVGNCACFTVISW